MPICSRLTFFGQPIWNEEAGGGRFLNRAIGSLLARIWLTAKVKEDTHAHDPIPFARRHL